MLKRNNENEFQISFVLNELFKTLVTGNKMCKQMFCEIILIFKIVVE